MVTRRKNPKLPEPVRLALQELKEGLCQLYGDRFRALYLYGSYARGTARRHSDVDVLLTLAGPTNPYEEIDRASDLLSGIELAHDVLIGFTAVSEDSLARRTAPVLSSVAHEGVLL